MLQFEELKRELEEQEAALQDLGQALGLEKLREEVEMLEHKSAEPGFWDNMEQAQKITQRMAALKGKDEAYQKLQSRAGDCMALIEMGDEAEDLSLVDEAKEEIESIKNEIASMKLSTLLTGEYDKNNAILTFHAGSGGTEAQDWAEMLFRMYNRWAERHGFKVTTLDYLDGDEAGLKSASIMVEGENAYGYLKSEAGVHRLVRVSPFDAAGRRHTSFSSLEVMPEMELDNTVEIPPEDIKMEVYRASGAGGQKVNKTSSAVRLIHIPPGITVSCQVERSQFQNREVAMKMLVAKLMEIKERENLEKISDIKGEQKEITWGSQIRSYVFMPYTMVKDHRTGYETGNVNAVMDGDLDGFINAYLTAQSQGTLGENIEYASLLEGRGKRSPPFLSPSRRPAIYWRERGRAYGRPHLLLRQAMLLSRPARTSRLHRGAGASRPTRANGGEGPHRANRRPRGARARGLYWSPRPHWSHRQHRV